MDFLIRRSQSNVLLLEINVDSAVRPNSSGAYCKRTSAPGQENVPGVTERTK
nr:hypothetical protein [Nostoc favosum]